MEPDAPRPQRRAVDLPANTDVLIVGAGPSGLALAAALRLRGVQCLIIDRLAGAEHTSRAAAVHARTLEALEPLGVVSRMLQEGLTVPLFRARDRDRILITLDFRQIPGDYGFILMCPQDRTEAILDARLQSLGGGVMRGAELTDLDLRADGVVAGIACDGARRMVDARWVVGCDGMHSRVREAAAMAFAGAAYEQGFVLGDVHLDWPLERDEVTLLLSPRGLVVVAPLPLGRHRIVATLDDAPAQPSIADLQALLDERGSARVHAHIVDCVWSSRFRVQHRLVSSPRRGRVLLCGDSAHVHSPAGGQGMNTGIQDSVALAGALAAVLEGGTERALDLWATSRHEVAEGVVAMTDRMTRMATLQSPVTQALRNWAIAFAGHIPPFARAAARNLAELDRR